MAIPAEFKPALFQSVVLLPARVIVNPSITTFDEVTAKVEPPPPIGPLTIEDPIPAPKMVNCLFTVTSSLYVPASTVIV